MQGAAANCTLCTNRSLFNRASCRYLARIFDDASDEKLLRFSTVAANTLGKLRSRLLGYEAEQQKAAGQLGRARARLQTHGGGAALKTAARAKK